MPRGLEERGELVGKVVDVAPRSAGFYTWW